MSSIKTPNSKFNLINERVKYGTDGGINVDSGTLVVNSSNNRVGINTLNPTSTFDVSGSIKSTSTIDYSNSTGNNTQILTEVNNQNLWSYSGYDFNANNIFPQQSVDISAIVLNDTTSTYKYAGGVLAPNGKIYCIPLVANNVGIIDPNTNTIDTTTIPTATGGKYLGGVLAPNGKIYCIPGSATNVGIIDPVTNTIDTTTISMTRYPDLSANLIKFWGGVLATNGKIYCSPRDVTYVGIIDPINNTFDSTSITFTRIQSGGGTLQYPTGALGSNGNIYFCPFDATSVLRVRPTDNSLNFINVSSYPSFGNGRWYGAACGPDGNVHLMPYGTNAVVRIDVSTETIIREFDISDNQGWCSGAVLGLDGIIYGTPNRAGGTQSNNKLLFYDVLNNTGGTIVVTTNNYTEKWVGGVLAPNGKIYMIPTQYTRVATIKTGIPKLPPWMMAPEFNKF
jgi:hypothetical protein